MPSGLQVYSKTGELLYDSSTWRYLRQLNSINHVSVNTSRYAYYKELIVTYNLPAYDPVISMYFDQGSNKLIRGAGNAMTWVGSASFFRLGLTVEQAIAKLKPILLIGF